MELVEGRVTVGGDQFPDTDALVSTLSDIGDRHDVTVQAFDTRYVAGKRHLTRALKLADRERARDNAIARDRAVEVLLYAAGRRQIRRALEMGIGDGETPAVVLVAADGPHADEAAAREDIDAFLESEATLDSMDTERLTSFFDIGDDERAVTDATLSDLVSERVALLVVER